MRTILYKNGGARQNKFVVPETRAEIRDYFGVAKNTNCPVEILTLPEPVGNMKTVEVHPKAKKQIALFFKRIHAEGLWPCIRSIGPCRSAKHRANQYPVLPSLHQWGAAVTLNPDFNKSRTRTMAAPRMDAKDLPGPTFYPDHPIVRIAEEVGLHWMGGTSYPEPAEFELFWGK